VKTDDLKRYKANLQLTNAHLQGCEPGENVQTSRRPKSETLFQSRFLRQRGFAELKFHYGNTGIGTDMAGKLYFDCERPTGFSTLITLHPAGRGIGKTAGELRAWPEVQDAYTLHRPVRTRFPRNPYTVNNIMEVRECDLVEVQRLNNMTMG